MIVAGDWVIPVSDPPVPGGAVLIRGGVIVEVGPAAELRARHPGEESREYPGCVVLPGLVNIHTHLDYSAFLGFRSSRGFMSWIIRLTRARMKLDAEDLAASALWGAYECVRQGVTSIADTSYGGSTVARAAMAAGLRARVYLEVFGLDDSRLAETIGRLEASLLTAQAESALAGGSGDGRLEWGISPHATYTVSQALYREVARSARRSGMSMASHVAESKAEVRLLARGSGLVSLVYRTVGLVSGGRWRLPRVRPLQYVAEADALGPDMLVVHAVQLDAADIDVLAKSGAAVAHCPRSNQNLGCGIAPVVAMREAGIVVGLGTDSLASNDSLDMLAEMRAALEASRVRAEREGLQALLPSEVMRMATLDGARALGWEGSIGSLEAGKGADIAVVRLPKRLSQTISDDDLVLAAMSGEVIMTMAGGRVVYEGEGIPESVAGGFASVRGKLGLRDRPLSCIPPECG